MIETPSQRLSRNPSNAGYTNPLRSYSVPATDNEDGTINVPAQPVYSIVPGTEPIPIVRGDRPWLNGTPQLELTNDAQACGAIYLMGAVPVGRIFVPDYAICDYVASGTVGNRILCGRMTDGITGNVIWSGVVSAAVAAGVTANYDWIFGGGTVGTGVRRNLANTANTTVGVREVAPKLIMNQNSRFILQDTAAIDNADTFSYRIYGTEYIIG